MTKRGLNAPPSQHPCVLADVLTELDVRSLHVLVGHLEAAGQCKDVRATCKALRDLVDVWVQRVKLHMLVKGGAPVVMGFRHATPSPLLLRPSCTKIRLRLEADEGWRDAGDGDEDGEEDGEEGEEGEPCSGGEESGHGHGGAQPGVDESQQPEQAEPQAGGSEVWDSRRDPTRCATRLALLPFQGVPTARREQITELELALLDWRDAVPPPVNLSHVLQALGPQLPRLQHLDLSRCPVSGWEVRPGECDQELPAVLAAAFPHLQALWLNERTSQLDSLAAHMGARLARLVYTKAYRWTPFSDLRAALPRFTGLKSLMLEHFIFDRDELRLLLDALPPALESLQLLHLELLNASAWRKGALESQLELVLRGGAVQVLRVGWVATPADLDQLHHVLTRSKLATGLRRLPLLQLAGLRIAETLSTQLSAVVWPGRFALAQHFECWDVGRLHVTKELRAEDMAALAEQCRPEEVACGGCVVRLRGSGPPPTVHDFLPRWALGLGGIWERWGDAVRSGRPAPGVAEAMVARGLRLETASGKDAAAVALGALRRGVSDVLRAAEAGAAQQGREGGLQHGGASYSCDLLLLVGPFLRMLGPEAALEAWLRGLCDQVAAARGQPRTMAGQKLQIQQYAQIALPQHGGGGARRGAEPAGVGPGFSAAVGGAAGAAAGAAAGMAGAGSRADPVVLLACDPALETADLERELAEVCAPSPVGSLLQGMSPGLKVLRLQGTCISSALHDAYLSPVLQALWDGSAGGRLGERQRLEKLCALWGAVMGVARAGVLTDGYNHLPHYAPRSIEATPAVDPFEPEEDSARYQEEVGPWMTLS